MKGPLNAHVGVSHIVVKSCLNFDIMLQPRKLSGILIVPSQALTC